MCHRRAASTTSSGNKIPPLTTPTASTSDTSGDSSKSDIVPRALKNSTGGETWVPKAQWIDPGKGFRKVHPVFLRDACSCASCIDPSSRQKKFQTTDIPNHINVSSMTELFNGDIQVTWTNDLPGFNADHKSIYSPAFFKMAEGRSAYLADREMTPISRFWDGVRIKKVLRSITYNEYVNNDKAFATALLMLQRYGLLIVRDVPEAETAVENLACRMGPIRDTFYGRTWDVKSVPNAKNVAYTHQYLGLHMDLLYMADPPGFQFLHCLQNSCEGGESIFVDSFTAAYNLERRDLYNLAKQTIPYHYRNAGEHYFHEHPVIELSSPQQRDRDPNVKPVIEHVNYSPPFQADHIETSNFNSGAFERKLDLLRKFAAGCEDPKNLFEYKLQPGECVIFNNRRVLHGRRQFEATAGERWLKGTYVDTDVFMSRWRVMSEAVKATEDKKFDLYLLPLVDAESRRIEEEKWESKLNEP